MRAEEGVEDRRLVPAHEQRGRRVAEEAAHVGAGEGEAAEADREEHGLEKGREGGGEAVVRW